MIVGIKDIYLYAGLTEGGGSASATAKIWLEEQGITFNYLFYGDPAQHESVFSALGTWFTEEQLVFADFPFVIYDELHDNFTSKQRCLYGLAEITESNLPELFALTPSFTGGA